MTETFLCPNCGEENLMSHRFCAACGTRLAAGMQQSEKTCSKCGAQNPTSYRFCGSCGVKLDNCCPNCGANVPADSRYCPNCAYLCGDGRYEAV
ncbi:MAG: zinc-ribbon domain-containing protein [Chloroflexi bacterium]|nr:zinc-ribbon domain-containing protein [Chloroflexota bacterium]